MTKNEELRAIAELATILSAHDTGSYCGQWLREQLPHIQQAMHSDMPVETRAYTHEDWVAERENEGQAIVHKAKCQADRLIAQAKQQAKELLGAVQQQCSGTSHEIDTMRARLAELRLRAGNLASVIDNVTLSE